MVKGLHPLVDPLAAVLPGPLEPLPVQLPWVDAEDLSAEPLDGLYLDPLGAAQPTGRLDRTHIRLERLGPGQRLQVLDALLGGPGLEHVQQGAGGQLGARIGAPQWRTALLPGGWVQALEHRLHLLRAGDSLQAGRSGGAADEAAW